MISRHGLLYGLDVTCFEASSYVGGLWRYREEETESKDPTTRQLDVTTNFIADSCVMKSTVINTSKEMTAYSDFPPEPNMANFMHNTEMYRYLVNYADHYDLKKYIKFQHKVLNIERAEGYAKTGQWKVTYDDQNGGRECELFDGVLLCCGHHALPRMPTPWPGQNLFKGDILHSHSYRSHKGYEDKVVVVVTPQIRSVVQVYLATRRGTWVCNRIFDYGQPFDLALNRFVITLYGEYVDAHPTVNDELPNRMACGTVLVRPNILEFTEHGVIFENGSRVENVDTVIFATGYQFHFPMVECGQLIPVKENEVDLYEYMYPTETADHNSLAVVGLIQPVGSIMPISEMQARVFYENLFGTHKIPSAKEMRKSIKEKKEAMSARYVKSPRHTIQVDYINYMDELASLVGCKPNVLEMLKSDPMLAIKIYFGPCVPYVYRLQGPHSWTGARQAIMSVDERVFKATNSSQYTGNTFHGYWIVSIVVVILLILIF
ncbi:unnamed protein product [Nippostrongylus brasiliensis]|uniref:Flavin-containing monooxygenase n=1 Tax=Nippostrongylus brasiliensis TaxID=27835 RepID=A0A3P7BXR1_NIPBR|nr:unnamed protein product [Nippostrongylus brasiliensis]